MKLTDTEKIVTRFVSGLGGQRYKEIFDLLEQYGLKPLGKSNTETLLFQVRDSTALDIFAFRHLGRSPT